MGQRGNRIPRILSVVLACWLGDAVQAQPGCGVEASQTVPVTHDRDAFVAEFQAELRRHPYFKKVELELANRSGRVVLFIQKVAKQEHLPAKLRSSHLPWWEALVQEFESGYANPMGLTEQRHFLPLIVLASEGDLLNYRKVRKPKGFNYPAFHFDRELGLTVAHQEGRWLPRVREDLLEGFCLNLLHAHVSPKLKFSEDWVILGLSQYLSMHKGTRTSDLAKHALSGASDEWIQSFVSGLGRSIYFGDLSVFLKTSDMDAAAKDVRARAKERLQKASTNTAFGFYYSFSHYWTHFLHQVAEPSDRAAYLLFLKEHLNGQERDRALATVFSAEDLERLESGLFAFLEDLVEVPEEAVASEEAEADGADGAKVEALPREEFQLRAEESFEQFAAAEALLAEGDFAGALLRLKGLKESSADSELLRMAGQAIERTQAWIEVRESFVKALLDGGARLRWPNGDKRVTLSVNAENEGVLSLARNKVGLTEVRVAHLTPSVIADSLGTKFANYGPVWLRGHAKFIENDRKWKRYVEGKTEGAQSPGLSLLTDTQSLQAAMNLGPACSSNAWLSWNRFSSCRNRRVPRPRALCNCGAITGTENCCVRGFWSWISWLPNCLNAPLSWRTLVPC